MLENIDAQLSQSSSKVFSNPLDLYKLGIEYEMRDSRISAARRLLGDNYNLLDPTSFARLSAALPSTKYMGALVAVQGARYKILTEVLLSGNIQRHGLSLRVISCDACRMAMDIARENQVSFSLPSWMVEWTASTHKALVLSPLKQCLPFFDASIFDASSEYCNFICWSCLECLRTSTEHKENFNLWARFVKNLLMKRLKSLEPLYNLC
ncbi:hypothetical protein FRC12_020953 [Ceratobasidium sp. 428]|nr:hypothetical protein FRC12_020953 [Ceratobasidium sp. 428]